MTNEPVFTAGAIVAAIGALLAALVSLGVIHLSPEQQTAILTAAAAILPLAAALWARQQVTPLTQPRDTDGTPLSRPGDVPANKELAALQADAISINKETTAQEAQGGKVP